MNLLEEFPIPVPKYQMLVGCLQQYPLLTEHESQEDLVDSDVLLHKGQVHSWKNESHLQHANCHTEQLVSSASEVKYLDELVSLKYKHYVGFSLLMNTACDITSNMNTWQMLQYLSCKRQMPQREPDARHNPMSHTAQSWCSSLTVTNTTSTNAGNHLQYKMSLYFHKLSITSNKKHKMTSKVLLLMKIQTIFAAHNNVNEWNSLIPCGMKEIHFTKWKSKGWCLPEEWGKTTRLLAVSSKFV